MNESRVEMGFRVPGHENLDVWVSLDDALRLVSDRMLYGNCYVEEIRDRHEQAMVTHRRIAPSGVTV